MKKIERAAVVFGLVLLSASAAGAGEIIYEKGDKKIEIGARIQLQYTQIDPDGAESVDELFFRRLRPYIAGTVSKDWWGKIQFDFGKSLDADEVAVRDAYIQYKGWDNIKLTIGNSKTPFSREFMSSSKRQQGVERNFVGAHNFGVPDRQLGLRLDGNSMGKKLTWIAIAGSESHDPGVRRMDFDSPANRQFDWNQGWIASARLDLHPMGHVKFDQGDFRSDEIKLRFGLGAFTWSNDGDRNLYTDDGVSNSRSKADLDSAIGIEIGVGLRGKGISVDAEYQIVSGETVDPAFSGGIYVDGETELKKISLEGGYMLSGNRFEIVGSWEQMDADGYEQPWQATLIGFNYFFNRHKVKAQFNYIFGENVFGVAGVDANTIHLRMQFVF
ncbi:MAG: porin [Thermoanaerobaculales bacterium]